MTVEIHESEQVDLFQIFVVEINGCRIFLTDSNVRHCNLLNAEFEWLADCSGHSTTFVPCRHTNSSMPLTKLLSSEARKTTALAISGVLTRPTGYR